MRKFGIIAVLSLLLTALAAVPALAAVAPGTYTPTADSFDSANAPGSSHLRSGTVQCIVNATSTSTVARTCSGASATRTRT